MAAIPESLVEVLHFEYISSDISIRKLACKHNVSKSALEKLIKKGAWTLEKRNLHQTAQETARRQTEAKTGQYVSALSERAEHVYSATDKLLALVDRMLENAEAMAPRDLQAMSSTLMNIKQLHDIRPDMGDDSKSKAVSVTFDGPMDNWAG